MYVCICKGVCDKRVREAIESGASTVSAVGRACGAGTDCGSCQDQIACMIEDHDEVRRPPGRVSLPMLVASLVRPARSQVLTPCAAPGRGADFR